MAARIEQLERDMRSSMPWFVFNATRQSAEKILLERGVIGSCIVRPSSKPNCFALSHRAFEDIVGHALIHVHDNGFQLESKPERHATIHDLLVSLEPDVDLSESNFNTELLEKKTEPADAGAQGNINLGHLQEIFPEMSKEDLMNALAKTNNDLGDATQLLLQGDESQASATVQIEKLLLDNDTHFDFGDEPETLPSTSISRMQTEPQLSHVGAGQGANRNTTDTVLSTSAEKRASKTRAQSLDPVRASEVMRRPHEDSKAEPVQTEPPAPEKEVEADLIVDRENNKLLIKAGTLPKLVERVTYEDYADPHFLIEFQLTYRSFTTKGELLTLLMDRYNLPVPDDIDRENDFEAYDQWKKEHQVPVRLRVINFLRSWIKDHWIDFDGDADLQERLENFVDQTVQPTNKGLAASLKKLLQMKQSGASKQKEVIFSEQPPKPLAPLDEPLKAEFNWMDYHPMEIARQLTIIEYDMYKKIRSWEFLNQGWSKKDREVRSPNVCTMVNRFNTVSAWVRTEIVKVEDLRERSHVMQRFIEIADKCRELNNLNCVGEIISGLNSASIYRLRHTWDALPPRSRDKFEELALIMKPQSSYKNFREYLHTCKPPCIPYLGVYLTDLTFIEDGCKTFVKVDKDDGTTTQLINFDKCRKAARVIQEISQYQDTPYNLTLIPYLKMELMRIRFEDEDHAYKESLAREARGSHQKEEDKVMARAPNSSFGYRILNRGRKEKVTDTDAFVGDSVLSRLSAPLPDGLEYIAKSALAVMETELSQVKDEPGLFQVVGPTTDERRVQKNYILRAENLQEMAEWMQALLGAGAVGQLSLSEDLASSNVYDTGGDVKAGFLYMRSQSSLLKGGLQRKWFVLDKKKRTFSHGDLVVPEPDYARIVEKLGVGDDQPSSPRVHIDACVFSFQNESNIDLFCCNTCRTDEGVAYFWACLSCVLNCHEHHDVQMAVHQVQSEENGYKCMCQKCVKKLNKERDKAAAAEGNVDGKRKKSTFIGKFKDVRKARKEKKGATMGANTLKRHQQQMQSESNASGGGSGGAAADANGGAAAALASSTGSNLGASSGSNAAVRSAPLPPVKDEEATASMRSRSQTGSGAAAPAAATTSTAEPAKPLQVKDIGAIRPANAIAEVVAVDDYVAEDSNELSLHTGERLWIFRKNNETGWWLGEIQSGENAGAKGWFPADWCEDV